MDIIFFDENETKLQLNIPTCKIWIGEEGMSDSYYHEISVESVIDSVKDTGTFIISNTTEDKEAVYFPQGRGTMRIKHIPRNEI